MGSCFSAEAVQQRQQQQAESMNNQMAAMMQNMAQMQQQHLANQQQMIRDDPECKDIMDRHLNIQQKMLGAMQAGDQSAMMQAQMESLELQKNPKYMKLMMPTSQMMTSSLFGKNGSGTTTTGPVSGFPTTTSRTPANVFTTTSSTPLNMFTTTTTTTRKTGKGSNKVNIVENRGTMQSMAGGMSPFDTMNHDSSGMMMDVTPTTAPVSDNDNNTMTANSMFSDMLNDM